MHSFILLVLKIMCQMSHWLLDLHYIWVISNSNFFVLILSKLFCIFNYYCVFIATKKVFFRIQVQPTLMSIIHCFLRSNYTNLLVIHIIEYLYLFISNNNFRQLQSFNSNENVDESSRKKRKYWNSSRFGDLNDEDFSTPRRRKKI